MTSLFISYSRKDTPIARRLTEAFKGQGLGYWIDWEGIPLTVEWWQEIERGIERADIFLFLLSPDSVRSKICRKEIKHAVRNGKRLVPVVVRDVTPERIPMNLRKLNWVNMRETDNFRRTFRKLITALQSDYEWAQTHSQLQIKALEWARSNRENSFLLHGKELSEAETEITTNSLKEPIPTDLQKEYVLKSRRVTDQTQQRFAIGLISFLILISGLLIFSIIQLNTSRAQRLGSQAQVSYAEGNYNTALLYAYQSNQISKNMAADLVLGQIAYKNFLGGTVLMGHEGGLYDGVVVAWSTQGQLASGSDDRNIVIWDLNKEKPAKVLNGQTIWVNSIAWSQDGMLATSESVGNTVIVWDPSTGQPIHTLKGHTQTVKSVAWSSDGKLASGSNDGTIIIWDLSLEKPAQILMQEESVDSIAWFRNNELASGQSDGNIIIWDIRTGLPDKTLKGHTSGVKSVAWSSSGELASGSYDGTIILWDLNTSRPAKTLSGHQSDINSVAWSPDGQLASGSDDDTVIIWDTENRKPAHILKGHTNDVISVSWSPDGKLASGSEGGMIIIWDLTMHQSSQTFEGHRGEVYTVAWSPKGQLASGSFDNTVIIWDLDSSEPKQTLAGHSAEVFGVAWSPKGQLASGSWDKTVIVWNLDTGKAAEILSGHTMGVTSVAWSPDEQLASGSNDGKVIIWDFNTDMPAQILQGYTSGVFSIITSIAWSSDGRLASSSFNGAVTIWNLDTGKPAQILTGYTGINSIIRFPREFTGGAYSLAWSPDGKLASGYFDGTVIIWDINTGQPKQTLKRHTSRVNSVAWLSNGVLASGSDDGTVIIWDLISGEPIQVLFGHSFAVNSIAWSPDGRIASASRDGTIKIPRSDLLIQNGSCNKIFRNMTIQEWADFQGLFYPYRAVCPNLYDPSAGINIINWLGRSEFSSQLLSFTQTFIKIEITIGVIILPLILWRRNRQKRKRSDVYIVSNKPFSPSNQVANQQERRKKKD